jgi:DnaJ family protein A protein 2
LIVVLQQAEHDLFTRNQDDLFMEHSINITEALCGFEFVITHLDGRKLVLKQKPGDVLAPGAIRAVANEGMPIYKSPFEKGNLYITFKVKFPESNTFDEETIKVGFRILTFVIIFQLKIRYEILETGKTFACQTQSRHTKW